MISVDLQNNCDITTLIYKEFKTKNYTKFSRYTINDTCSENEEFIKFISRILKDKDGLKKE